VITRRGNSRFLVMIGSADCVVVKNRPEGYCEQGEIAVCTGVHLTAMARLAPSSLLLCKYICVNVSGPPWGLLLLLLLLLLFTLPIPVTTARAEGQAKVQAPGTLESLVEHLLVVEAGGARS